MVMNKEDLENWFKKETEKLYGTIIDRLRSTELSERAFSQMSKYVKQDVRESLEGIMSVIENIK